MKPWSARVGFAGCLLGFVLSIPLWLDASPVTLPDAPAEGPDEHTLNPIQAGRPAKAAEVQHNFKVLAGAVNELAEAIRVKEGKVGVGTAEPSQKIEIKDGNLILHRISKDGSVYIGHGGSDGAIAVGGSGGAQIEFEDETVGGVGAQRIHFITHRAMMRHARSMTIDELGNVGIGTTTPESSLHVAGDIATSPTIGGVHIGKGAGTESALIQLAGIGGEALIDFTDAAGEDADYRMGLRNDGRWKVGPGTGPQAIVIESNGKVGIGGSVPTSHNATLYVRGIGAATAGWINDSDARWKKDVETFTGALEAVESLRGVRYRWRREEFPDMNFPEGEQLGLIAQEVEGVLPELVHTDAEGTKSLEYAKLVAVLVEAIKEQQDRIDAQARVLEDVQRLLEDQQARLAALEAERARR